MLAQDILIPFGIGIGSMLLCYPILAVMPETHEPARATPDTKSDGNAATTTGHEAIRATHDERTGGDRLGVKASGGIRDTATALAMLNAGASRLGMSGTRAVLDGLPA